MAEKIGVYFDLANIGGGLDAEVLAEHVRASAGEAAPVVRVVPELSLAVESIKADIGAQGLDGILLCGASPRAACEAHLFPAQVEYVNLREQCALAYKNPDGTLPGDGTPPELLREMAIDYLNMGIVKLQKSNAPTPAAIERVPRILVIGGGWTGITAALEAADTGYDVVLAERADRLGGAANHLPVCSPLASPWEESGPVNLAARVERVTNHERITVHLGAHVEQLEGQPGEYRAVLATADGTQSVDVGAVVLATGWTALDGSYLAPMGLGTSPRVVHAFEFGKMLLEGRVNARRIAFVLDTTIAEEAARARDAQNAATAAAEEEEKAATQGEDGEEDGVYVKKNLESIRHLRFSNAVNSVGMLRLANAVCETDNDATQAFILYRHMTVPGILERFYKKMQDRLGVMMTRADVTEIREDGDHMVVSCKNTLLGMDFDLDVDMVVLPTGIVPTTARELPVNFGYRQGPDFPDLSLSDGFADSNYICFPYETRRTGVYAAGCVHQPMTLDACEEDARGAVLKAIQCIEAAGQGVAVHPRSLDSSYPEFNFVRCTQCKRCTEECPFGALDDDAKGTPKPNPARCRRCGTCFGACPERVISFANYNIDQIGSMIREVRIPKDFKRAGPRILILACENDAYPALDMAGLRRKPWSPYCRIIPVRCLGSVNAIWISDAMSKGFDGVMLLGCKYGNDYQCHFVKGSEICNRRKENIAETLNRLGVEPERVEQFEVAIDEYDRVPVLIDDFVSRITAMGPNPFKAM